MPLVGGWRQRQQLAAAAARRQCLWQGTHLGGALHCAQQADRARPGRLGGQALAGCQAAEGSGHGAAHGWLGGDLEPQSAGTSDPTRQLGGGGAKSHALGQCCAAGVIKACRPSPHKRDRL